MAKKKKEEAPKADSLEHLQAEHYEISKKLYEVSSEYRMTRKLEKPHLLRKYKRDIARVLTQINQKKRELNEQSVAS